jgi:phthalate 4,5-dioxygenase reductase component
MNETDAALSSPHGDIAVKITHKAEIATGIFRFNLAPLVLYSLPPFQAGAHIGVRVPIGITRKYSLCGSNDDLSHYTIAVKREEKGSGGSKSLIDDTHIGSELIITQPANDFSLHQQATHTLLIAGGIGITPLYAMLQELRQNPAHKVKLIYLTRNRASTAFYDELTRPELKGIVTIHHDNGNLDESFDLWPLLEKPMGRHIYCCGPRPLMDAVKDMSGHWPASSVHFEDFGSSSSPHQRDNHPFSVHLARSHKDIMVPADISILDAIRANGVYSPSSCESGSCGSCKTRLLKGKADHRDLVLAPDEQDDYIIICVSRAQNDSLELDL